LSDPIKGLQNHEKMTDTTILQATPEGGFSSAPSALKVMTAAVKDGKGRIHTLPRPNRHGDVKHDAEIHGLAGPYEEGFVLSDGEFADRKQAEAVARECGQKTGPLVHPHIGGLSSDDLW
jgi:hypothetical protein